MLQTPFSEPLDFLLSPVISALSGDIDKIAGLQHQERDLILASARSDMMSLLHDHLARTLVLELRIAREQKRLTGATSAERWRHFVALASEPRFWRHLHRHYPPLAPRIDHILRNRRAAAFAFARAWAADRPSVGALCAGKAAGLLRNVHFSAGDSHREGRTVVIATCDGGKLVYKPRPMDVDVALSDLLRFLGGEHSERVTAMVPGALAFRGHGWAAFTDHRYATDESELRDFYRGIGQWLGVLRLLGGTDMHAHNLIAHGAHPVIIDCETLFTPQLAGKPSGYGHAADRAANWRARTVLGTGMLPGRGQGLGWRGIDMSSVGALPQQQPAIRQPALIDAGTDQAHWGETTASVPVACNHPTPHPLLFHHWPEILEAFDRINDTLRRLDASGTLQRRLRAFADCEIRIVLRPTAAYAELARMLWHPVSLHNEENATERARDLLGRMAAHSPMAPDSAAVIDAEIAELKQGDIPYFSAIAKQGELCGPNGTRWIACGDLVDGALAHWRAADLRMERGLIHAALASAYVDDGTPRGPTSHWPRQARHGDADRRRRAMLVAIMQDLSRHAIRGDDGTVTWLAPGFHPDTGWSIRPMAQDLYSGLPGVALLIAAYRHEAKAGRAEPMEELDSLLQGVLSSMRIAEDRNKMMLADRIRIRPYPVGGYVGLGSMIWTWLTLDALGAHGVPDIGHGNGDRADVRAYRHCTGPGTKRACDLALLVPQAADDSETLDILYGVAGAIPPLLALARVTGNTAYLDMSKDLGNRLCATAIYRDGRAYWAQPRWPDGIGGFSHGATGIGWALAKLSRASGDGRYRESAEAAFDFEENLFDDRAGTWLDLRGNPDKNTTVAWCHGAIGIGAAHLDLDPDLRQRSTPSLLRRAVAATWSAGLAMDHGICHGDASAWEFLDAAIAKGLGPAGLSREALLAQWLTRLEQHDLPRNMAGDTFQRGLMTGTSGIAYQLLRADPRNELPSVLTPGGLRDNACRP
jgi:type 2 lantibiotic biosynthesis protein LanM